MEVQNQASIPRSEKILGRADGPASLAVGDVVRIASAKVGNRYQIVLADPSSSSGVPAVAIVLKKLGTTDYKIQFHGPVKSTYTGLTPGEIYYLGTDGALATVGGVNFPIAGGAMHFQQLGAATSTDELLLQVVAPRVGSATSGSRYYHQSVAGIQNGVNTAFTSAQTFIASGPRQQVLVVNGVRQEPGVGCDYEVSESVPSAGFDTLTLAYSPLVDDVLRLDFDPDL